MFAHFDGIVAEKNADSIVLDVNGVGYLLFVSGATLSMAPAVGERMKLYSVLNVREDYLSFFSMGQAFVGKVPALGNEEMVFKVNYISPLGSFATWKNTDSKSDYDMRTFEIHALPLEKTNGLRPGMSVLVTMQQ